MSQKSTNWAVIGYHTGLRAGIIRGLIWEWTDLEHHEIRLPRGNRYKRNPAVVPIYGEMVAAFEMAKTERDEYWRDCPWVVHIGGRQVGPDVTHQSGWKSACRAAGLEGLLFHDLRRSAIRNMRLAGIAENVAMKISGHKTRSVFERYSIVSERDVAEAGRQIGEFLDLQRTRHPVRKEAVQ